MKALLLIAAMTLAGCGNTVLPGAYMKAEEMCSTNGGVKILLVNMDRVEVLCRNSARFLVDRHFGQAK